MNEARRATVVWGVAVAAYIVAVLHRASFGVAGLEATERFGVSATVLSTFVVVQLAVYAAMQIPVGVLLDRYGSRVLIASGAALMAGGQLLLAMATDLPLAYAARVLIGAGDACTYISVVRLIALWFPVGRVPLMTQVTGLLGQLGQLAAAVPLVAVLHLAGWQAAFVGLAAVGVLATIAAAAGVRDAPRPLVRPRHAVGALLQATVRTPGTRLGFWSHAASQFATNTFLLLWGFPFLTSAQGLSPALAGTLFSVNVVAAVVAGPVIGTLTARHPLRRSWMVLTITGVIAAVWLTVVALPSPAPLWLLVVLVVVLGVGGPGSVIGFDFARTSNPPERSGTANGVVNVGGFLFAVIAMLGIGVVLDLAVDRGAEPLSLEAFRPAFAAMSVLWAVAVVGVLTARRATRREMATRGVVVPPMREAVRRRRAERDADQATGTTGPARPRDPGAG